MYACYLSELSIISQRIKDLENLENSSMKNDPTGKVICDWAYYLLKNNLIMEISRMGDREIMSGHETLTLKKDIETFKDNKNYTSYKKIRDARNTIIGHNQKDRYAETVDDNLFITEINYSDLHNISLDDFKKTLEIIKKAFANFTLRTTGKASYIVEYNRECAMPLYLFENVIEKAKLYDTNVKNGTIKEDIIPL